MIWFIQPLGVGNAVRVLIQPPAGADCWRLLRRDDDAFAGPDDPTALVVYEGDDRAVVDSSGLLNGAEVFYAVYVRVAGVWSLSGAVRSIVPASSLQDLGVDVLSLVRDRIEDGMKVFVDRGAIRHDQNFVPVLKASPQVEDVALPLVTVHLQNAAMEVRAVGEVFTSEEFDEDTGFWESVEGGMDRVSLTIVCWSINSDQRVAMRKALRAVLQGNLPVFDAAGLILPSWSMQDMEDYQTYQVPMFQTVCSFDCLAPASVKTTDLPIVEAVALATAFFED